MYLIPRQILLTFQEANYFSFHNSHILMIDCVQHKLQISSVFLLAVSERTAPVKYSGTVVNVMDQWHDKQCNTPNT